MKNKIIAITTTFLLLFGAQAYAKAEMGVENEKAFRLFMFSQMLEVAALTCSSEVSDWKKEYDNVFSKWQKVNIQGLEQGELEVQNFYSVGKKNGKLNSSVTSFEDLKAGPAKGEKAKLEEIRKDPKLLKQYCGQIGTLLSKSEPIEI